MSGKPTWPWAWASKPPSTATGCSSTTAAALITTLTKAETEGRLDEKLKLYTVPRLLIGDEIGYLLFKRRTEAVGQLLLTLYLHGLATGDFDLALRGLLGDGAPLSAASIARLKAGWQAEYDVWKTRSLADLEPVFEWVDGVYVKAGLEKDKAAMGSPSPFKAPPEPLPALLEVIILAPLIEEWSAPRLKLELADAPQFGAGKGGGRGGW